LPSPPRPIADIQPSGIGVSFMFSIRRDLYVSTAAAVRASRTNCSCDFAYDVRREREAIAALEGSHTFVGRMKVTRSRRSTRSRRPSARRMLRCSESAAPCSCLILVHFSVRGMGGSSCYVARREDTSWLMSDGLILYSLCINQLPLECTPTDIVHAQVSIQTAV
jgi:hypothetical protein